MSKYLPVEMILEILKRLPVKSVVKCRSVCKTWNSLINNPSFISSHLQTALSKLGTPLLLLTLTRDRKDRYILHFDNDDFDEFKQLLFPFKSGYHRVVNSCNGVVCLDYQSSGYHYGEFILWNPSIQKYITLPKLKIARNDDYNKRLRLAYSQRCGFGFDSRIDDYKILVTVQVVVGGTGGKMTQAYLFSLNGNSWKKVNTVSPNYGSKADNSLSFVDGAFHWLGYERGKDNEFRNMVLKLDTSTEEFFVMSLPEGLLFGDLDLCLMKYEESSIAVLKRDLKYSELWVMKECGVVRSWSKVLNLDYAFGQFPTLLGFRENGKVLWETEPGQLASMDLKYGRMEDLGISTRRRFQIFNRYVESLVLLDKGVDAGGVNYAHNFDDGFDPDVSASS